jgi:hypothetical protein
VPRRLLAAPDHPDKINTFVEQIVRRHAPCSTATGDVDDGVDGASPGPDRGKRPSLTQGQRQQLVEALQ